MKRLLTILAATGCSALMNAQEATLSAFRYAGPYQLTAPLMVDSVDVNSKKFDVSSLLGTHLSFESIKDADVRTDMATAVWTAPGWTTPWPIFKFCSFWRIGVPGVIWWEETRSSPW